MDELESVRLVARETVQHCVEHIANWVEAQVGPSLSILFQTMGFPKIFELAVEAGSPVGAVIAQVQSALHHPAVDSVLLHRPNDIVHT